MEELVDEERQEERYAGMWEEKEHLCSLVGE
jgi:hypothetical protein